MVYHDFHWFLMEFLPSQGCDWLSGDSRRTQLQNYGIKEMKDQGLFEKNDSCSMPQCKKREYPMLIQER